MQPWAKKQEGIDYKAKEDRFDRIYLGWRHYMENHPIAPPGGWSAESREDYFHGADLAKNAKAEELKAIEGIRNA